MKKIKNILIALCISLTMFNSSIYISASTKSKEYKSDYTDWSSLSFVEYPPIINISYDYNGNEYDPFGSLIDNSFHLTTKSGEQSLKDSGSLLYCMSYMMVASGMVNEYNEMDSTGFHPGFLFDAIYETHTSESWNSIDDTSENYKDMINVACLDSASKSTLKFSERIDISTGNLGMGDIENKITELISKGKYVLLKYKDSKVHWVFVTGIRVENEKSFISVLNPENDSTELKYSTDNLVSIESWDADSSLVTRLDWYRNYANKNNNTDGVPVYLKLINRSSRLTDADISNQQYVTYLGAKINRIIYNDLLKLYTEAKDVEGFNVEIEKGYESTEDTYKDYNLYTNNNDISDFMLGRYVNKYESEHNIGMAIDFKNTYTDKVTLDNIGKTTDIVKKITELDEEFKKTKYYTWLVNNSYKYGFIYRYPADVGNTTGLSEIPNHFRYIGVDYAKKFVEFTGGTFDDKGNVSKPYSNGKTFESFYEEVIEKDFATSELKDLTTEYERSENYYSNNIIRMYTYITDHSITCISKFMAGIFQIFHESASSGGVGNILNCDFLITYMKSHNTYLLLTVVCSVLFALAIVYYCYILICGIIGIKELSIKLVRGLVLTFVPIFFLYFVGGTLKSINNSGLSGISSRVAIYDLFKYKVNQANLETDTNYQESVDSYQRYEVYSDSDIQDLAFSDAISDRDKYSDILFTIKGLNGTASEKSIRIDKLYDELFGDTFYTSLKEDSSDSIPSYMLYQCDKFVPVNYNKYSKSVFYYFYDYVMYQYLSYWSTNKSYNKNYSEIAKEFTAPQEVNGQYETLPVYANRIHKLQNEFTGCNFNGVKYMYNDNNYTHTSDYVKDLFGLSYMFRMTIDSSQYSYVDETYLNSTTLRDWSNTKYQDYKNRYGTYSDWLRDLKNGSDSRSDIEVLSTLCRGDFWTYYNVNKISKGRSDSLKDYQFSPRFLQKELKKSEYAMFNDTDILERSDLSKLNDCKRVPWRVYGSFAKLYQDTGECKSTDFEKHLNNINENAFKSINEVINLYSGKVSDDIMIFYCALEATSAFNKEFGAFGTNVNPQGISSTSFDLDRLLKGVYSTGSVSSYSKGLMYSVTEDYSILTSFNLLLFDLSILITGACRCLLLLVMNLSIVLACSKILFTVKFKLNEYVVGLFGQLIVLFSTHYIYVGAIKLISKVVVSSSKFNVFLITLGLLIISLLILAVTLSSSLCMIKSISTFGGAKILNLISKAVSDVKMEKEIESDVIEADKVDISKEVNKDIDIKVNRDINNLKVLKGESPEEGEENENET